MVFSTYEIGFLGCDLIVSREASVLLSSLTSPSPAVHIQLALHLQRLLTWLTDCETDVGLIKWTDVIEFDFITFLVAIWKPFGNISVSIEWEVAPVPLCFIWTISINPHTEGTRIPRQLNVQRGVSAHQPEDKSTWTKLSSHILVSFSHTHSLNHCFWDFLVVHTSGVRKKIS